MRRVWSTLALFVAIGTAWSQFNSQHNTLTKEERASGWRLLFDGKTMNGWQDPRQKHPAGDGWVIEEGCLKAIRDPRITEDLITKEIFESFELRFDWKLAPGGNSGVKYRIWDQAFLIDDKLADRSTLAPGAKGLNYLVAHEFQLIDNQRHPDALLGKDRMTGALYNFAEPTADATRPAGEWNRSRLVVNGRHVEHWVNYTLVLALELDDPHVVERVEKRWSRIPEVLQRYREKRDKPSPIALQNHGDSTVWFRNLKIRTTSGSR
jgi:hypothetical protein